MRLTASASLVLLAAFLFTAGLLAPFLPEVGVVLALEVGVALDFGVVTLLFLGCV